MRAAALALTLWLELGAPAAADELLPEVIEGKPVVIDGDTLWIGEAKIRLWAIDTPELKDRPWGPPAQAALDAAIGTNPVLCQPLYKDRYGRFIAVCQALVPGNDPRPTPIGEHDLAKLVLDRGLAVIRRDYVARDIARLSAAVSGPLGVLAEVYEKAQADARWSRVGVWAGE